MIDEKKLIEERPEWLNPNCVGKEEYNKGWNACNKYWCNTIKRQPKVGEWIPCSERLPNINSTVLVQRGTYAECKGKPIIDIAKFINRKTGFFEREKGFYQAWYSMPLKYDDVIAWMPLPEPYKGESE